MDILLVSAWFHDSGYLFTYRGHEDAGMAIAGTFLIQHQVSRDFMNEVFACIEATKMPQLPKNILQEIICDADLYHFSSPDYPIYAEKLRREWAEWLDKHFSDKDWNELNWSVMRHHQYFTNYGKTILQAKKQKNMALLMPGT
ncbi:hypothetical protein [Mucilaginibacter sp. FT3.2]|uniref:HD domain-containing protein n=1 Tax=Mucilaginibacter sp. FT3.2 TaxID=2723090 RepID=UPI001613F8D1|nr:hypothetical protein [Mucilaginibacter sp. FT3.2]MBB6235107.1 putative metal-dependent HD superfamily phosphohydrolase [Mucilaginibacter sp. FT3.2]